MNAGEREESLMGFITVVSRSNSFLLRPYNLRFDSDDSYEEWIDLVNQVKDMSPLRDVTLTLALLAGSMDEPVKAKEIRQRLRKLVQEVNRVGVTVNTLNNVRSFEDLRSQNPVAWDQDVKPVLDQFAAKTGFWDRKSSKLLTLFNVLTVTPTRFTSWTSFRRRCRISLALTGSSIDPANNAKVNVTSRSGDISFT
jgi:hypothetical protein